MAEHLEELPTDPGLPTVEDMQRWRAIVENKQRGSTAELVGFKEVETGQIMGIFRRKRFEAK